jgi:MarR family transcriptional regulator for hemolysin
MTQKEIADRIGIEASTIVPIIDKLEEQGMVARKPDPGDRRNNLVFLTEKSEAKWESVIECALEIDKASRQGISDEELQVTRATLHKIAQNVRSLYQEDSLQGRIEKEQGGSSNAPIPVKKQHLQGGKQRRV